MFTRRYQKREKKREKKKGLVTGVPASAHSMVVQS